MVGRDSLSYVSEGQSQQCIAQLQEWQHNTSNGLPTHPENNTRGAELQFWSPGPEALDGGLKRASGVPGRGRGVREGGDRGDLKMINAWH